MRSDQQRLGRYSYGGTSTVSGNNITWWERAEFPRDVSDVEFIITPKYHLRPDLLAYDLYGKSGLMWFILQFNNIVDVQEEFIIGSSIMLPTKTRAYSELLTVK